MRKILLIGGAGFIGSAVARHIINDTGDAVCIVDKLTYAGNLESLGDVCDSFRYRFEEMDICDHAKIDHIFNDFKPDVVMHFAAELHVDRAIDAPGEFIRINVTGTYTLLETARKYYAGLGGEGRRSFRFHHVSTDEVYGSLDNPDEYFTETTSYAPSSLYSVSKAASDHLMRAWYRTFGLSTLIINYSNNCGPYHFPEKLIPLIILNALDGKELPVYGDDSQVRDWLYVEDHACALYLVATSGKPGETYSIDGNNEKQNIWVVTTICDLLDQLPPREGGKRYEEQITFVVDRPGHDIRYAIDASKICRTLGWSPVETFETGILKTIKWYLNHRDTWCTCVLDGSYSRERLGLTGHFGAERGGNAR